MIIKKTSSVVSHAIVRDLSKNIETSTHYLTTLIDKFESILKNGSTTSGGSGGGGLQIQTINTLGSLFDLVSVASLLNRPEPLIEILTVLESPNLRIPSIQAITEYINTIVQRKLLQQQQVDNNLIVTTIQGLFIRLMNFLEKLIPIEIKEFDQSRSLSIPFKDSVASVLIVILSNFQSILVQQQQCIVGIILAEQMIILLSNTESSTMTCLEYLKSRFQQLADEKLKNGPVVFDRVALQFKLESYLPNLYQSLYRIVKRFDTNLIDERESQSKGILYKPLSDPEGEEWAKSEELISQILRNSSYLYPQQSFSFFINHFSSLLKNQDSINSSKISVNCWSLGVTSEFLDLSQINQLIASLLRDFNQLENGLKEVVYLGLLHIVRHAKPLIQSTGDNTINEIIQIIINQLIPSNRESLVEMSIYTLSEIINTRNSSLAKSSRSLYNYQMVQILPILFDLYKWSNQNLGNDSISYQIPIKKNILELFEIFISNYQDNNPSSLKNDLLLPLFQTMINDQLISTPASINEILPKSLSFLSKLFTKFGANVPSEIKFVLAFILKPALQNAYEQCTHSQGIILLTRITNLLKIIQDTALQ
eukprot:gene609-757_t